MSPVRWTALAAALVVAVLGTPASAFAQAEDESTPVMVVLDASGSMKQADAPGPRIDAAKKAVGALVDALPDDARVGLTVYGTGTGSSDAERAAGCKDIRRLVPVSPVDRAAFGTAVAGIKASGYTPIGQSLRAAAAALPAEGGRSIVLVSDGEDTCAPPEPCQVAKELKAAGVDLVVHTIGFKVGAAARTELSCIAAATGGTYREADSGAALGDVLTNRVQRAIRPYTAIGVPIRGSATIASAPTLEPGQYLDTYEKGGKGAAGDGTIKFYKINLRTGDTPYVSATLAPPGVRVENITGFSVMVSLVDADGDGCTSTDGFASTVGVFGKVIPQSAVVAPGAVGGRGWRDSCSPEDPVYVRIRRGGDSYATQQLPMEIAFRIEPPVTAEGPAAVTKVPGAVPAPAETDPKPAAAGFSFNDAPVLAPGTYTDSIVSGETRYFKVHLDWGQRLAWKLTVPAQEGVGIQSSAFYVTLASPLRERAEESTGTRTYQLIGGKEDQTMSGSSVAPVRWTNRDTPNPYLDPYSVDGDYFLVLDASYPLGRPTFTMPFRLTVATDGAAEQGPTYVTAPGGPSASASPPTADPSTAAAGGGSGSEPARAWPLWAAGGTGAVLLVFLLGVVVWRRRTSVS